MWSPSSHVVLFKVNKFSPCGRVSKVPCVDILEFLVLRTEICIIQRIKVLTILDRLFMINSKVVEYLKRHSLYHISLVVKANVVSPLFQGCEIDCGFIFRHLSVDVNPISRIHIRDRFMSQLLRVDVLAPRCLDLQTRTH